MDHIAPTSEGSFVFVARQVAFDLSKEVGITDINSSLLNAPNCLSQKASAQVRTDANCGLRVKISFRKVSNPISPFPWNSGADSNSPAANMRKRMSFLLSISDRSLDLNISSLLPGTFLSPSEEYTETDSSSLKPP